MENQTSKANTAAAKMPALTHWRDRTKPWSPQQSDVVAWLVSQPDIANAVFQIAQQSGAIVFDPFTETWSGRYYQAGDSH